MTVEQIIKLARAYAAHKALTLATVSSYAANDGKLFLRMEAGADCTTRRAAKLALWFSDNWPPDLEWVAGVPRPSNRKAA